jgi:hypothetical protein
MNVRVFAHSLRPFADPDFLFRVAPGSFTTGLSKMVHREHFLNSALQKISREFTGSHEIPYEFLLARCSLADETSMLKQGSDLRNAPNLLRLR